MKKLSTRIVATMLSLTICLSVCLGAANSTISAKESSTTNNFYTKEHLTQNDRDFLKEFSKLYPYFKLDGNKVVLTEDLKTLKTKINFSEKYLSRTNEVLKTLASNHPTPSTPAPTSGIDQPNVFVKDWKVYFTYEDTLSTLGFAASYGPAAMTATLTVICLALPIVGPTLSIVISAGASLGFCYIVVQALENHQGVYFGITWNGIFPNYDSGCWNE